MNSLTKHIKESIKFTIAAFYFFYLKLVNDKPRHVVIYYHGIKKHQVAAFCRQMQYLADNCAPVKPSQIKTIPANDHNHTVAITFDDAFVSVFENAIPILKIYNLPAGIFIPAGNLGRPPGWNMTQNSPDRNETVMTAAQITALDKNGFEIFSHSVYHRLLTQIDKQCLQTELKQSKQILENIISHPVLGISCPHGACNQLVYDAIKKTGYNFNFTIEPYLIETSTDNLRIGRTAVSPDDGLIKFKLKVNGAYQALRCARTFKQQALYLFRALRRHLPSMKLLTNILTKITESVLSNDTAKQ
jgi:peptidoglycan/xylan/chitin deacetylase (PgdA/CDA1 family)